MLPPPEALGDVEEFRRLHDPAFHRLPAHVPLLPPFEPIRRDFLARFDAFRSPPLTVSFGEAVAGECTLGLTVVQGHDELLAMRDALGHALLDESAPRAAGPPCLRVGLFGSDAELELARRALGTAPELPPLTIRMLTLLLEDVRGIWHPVRERVLRANA